jgi:hypothetical protein
MSLLAQRLFVAERHILLLLIWYLGGSNYLGLACGISLQHNTTWVLSKDSSMPRLRDI